MLCKYSMICFHQVKVLFTEMMLGLANFQRGVLARQQKNNLKVKSKIQGQNIDITFDISYQIFQGCHNLT